MKHLSLVAVVATLSLGTLACEGDPMASDRERVMFGDLRLSLGVAPSSVPPNTPVTVRLSIRNVGSDAIILQRGCGAPALFVFERNGQPTGARVDAKCTTITRDFRIPPGDELSLIQDFSFSTAGIYRVRVVWSVDEPDLPPLEESFTVR